ncbi:MAG: tRNA (adenosine(37)-N6)-threonylcarbamoyltransferase complex dimerization subunit type 1 TsaB [Spirochaetes bacterium]|nr:tRNA (adenosine(37)-N6)-threonylcarbamoyltransferase complex dimerization subunit type 1 TsaB [Spirochaetota bacterium]
MNILLLDTATDLEIVALRYNGIIADKSAYVVHSHSVTLFDTIDNACNQLNTTIHNIQCIGVGIGPGSFTGIRIAVTTARMLAQILQIPLVGIPTPLLFACAIAHSNADCIVAFDAKKGRVFAARYHIVSDSMPIEILSPGDYTIESLFSKKGSDTLIAVGNGSIKYQHEMEHLCNTIQFIPDFIPDAVKMINAVELLYSQNPSHYADYRNVVPYYARKSDAEIMKELRDKKQIN